MLRQRVMRERGGPPRDQPPDQHHDASDQRGDRGHTGQHPEPVRGAGHQRVQQGVPVDDQQHIAHDIHQRRKAEHQHAHEQGGAHRRRRRPCLRGACRRAREPARRGPPDPNGVSRRSAVWARGAVARAGRAVRAPGRTAIHRKPGGSRGGMRCHAGAREAVAAGGPPCELHRGSAGGVSARGAISAPRQRGHHSRRRSRTFHRVPHWEHTWITGPA